MIARCATAFGVAEICLVGSRKFIAFGSHGAIDHVQLRHFSTLQQCCAFLQQERGCSVVGVEVGPSAQPVQLHPFHGPTAFMLGNEGSGLSAEEVTACDSLVYIPQHGPGTASLNVAVAASIVLHHFAVWAGFPERSRTDAKFDVGERPLRTARRGEVPLTESERGDERERRRLAKVALAQQDGVLGGALDCAGFLQESSADDAC
ncbi:hypothetical protein WJX81_008210 [Elliptochloris bilobata]|uniref:tRNA/rRNA methyltransferase SpoU type domain-containing protein n=1 Tax=Elliptochloris bilobata TaxID=381761 RepID=A0AAW1RI27_9CHLO